MLREIVKIDEDICDGCGECVPDCHEGALQIIDGKARLVSELMCDGLGACIGHCPQGAISIEKRVSELSHWPVQVARSQARRDIPVEITLVRINGEVLKSNNN